MDDLQIKVFNALRDHMDCISDRNKLKGILADFLFDDKKHLNLIMDAYDDDFPAKIQGAAEKSLVALQFIKTLANNYGISEDNAKWSIELWCAVLGYYEISDALSVINPSDVSIPSGISEIKQLDNNKEYDLGVGVYCAGIDFPFGRIVLTAKWNEGEKDIIQFAIGSTPDIHDATDEFVDKTYLDIEEGQFIMFTLDNMGYTNDLIEFKARKIAD